MSQELQSISPIRFVTFLSPVLYGTYEYIARYIGEHLSLPTSLHAGQELAEFARGQAELGFLCGLLYIQMAKEDACPVELMAAPVLHGERYLGAPLYFSDVVVRRESSFASFEDLRGCVWAYNEQASHSGYNVVCYSLLQRGETLDYFRRSIQTGAHLQSLRLVLDGQADATALDSHLLDTLLHEQPELAERLRVVAMLGPSTIPPLVVAKNLDSALKRRVQEILLAMHHDPQAARELSRGRIARFVTISDKDYNDVRAMFDQVQKQQIITFSEQV